MEQRVLAGRYQLVAKLGEGGMGSVWSARHLALGTPLAVKLIDPNMMQSPEAIARFEREAHSAATLRSVHVVQVIDYGVDNGTPFIAMELLEGETLAARLERVYRLSPTVTAGIVTQVARALARAHAAGIVHRDLKPANIFLVPEVDEDVAKVLDFGIAKQLDLRTNSDNVKTRAGIILGSPYYMSPEQALGQAIDHRSDIWALGVIACQCLTGQRPFDKDTPGALLQAICGESVPKPSALAKDVPGGFDAWFARAIARDPDDRFQSAAEAAAELRTICGTSSSIPANRHWNDATESGFGDQHSAVPALTPNRPSHDSTPAQPTRLWRHQWPVRKGMLTAIGGILLAAVGVSVIQQFTEPRTETRLTETVRSAMPSLPSISVQPESESMAASAAASAEASPGKEFASNDLDSMAPSSSWGGRAHSSAANTTVKRSKRSAVPATATAKQAPPEPVGSVADPQDLSLEREIGF